MSAESVAPATVRGDRVEVRPPSAADESAYTAAVTRSAARLSEFAVPDPHKGERIIVVHKPLSKSTDEIRDALSNAGLPNLWIPGADSFLEVEQIPMLGTGKLDLKGLQQLALAHYGARELQHA